MIKYITDISTDKVSLEVYECECGFHIGVDATYLEQVSEQLKMKCPSCKRTMKTGMPVDTTTE